MIDLTEQCIKHLNCGGDIRRFSKVPIVIQLYDKAESPGDCDIALR